MPLNSTETGQIRRFGLIALCFFGTLCGVGSWTDKTVPTYLFGTLALLGIGFVLMPGPMRPVHDTWLKIAHGIGRLVTAVMLALCYYVVMTPSAWIKRLAGGRPLPFKPDREAASYWVTRTEGAQPKARFFKRF